MIPSEIWWYFQIFSQTTWVDWVMWALVVWGIAAGFYKGLEHEFVGFTSITAAAFATHRYYKQVAAVFSERFPIAVSMGEIIFFFLIGIGVFVASPFILRFLATLVTVRFAPVISKPGGSLLAACRWVLTFSLASYWLQLFSVSWITQAYDSKVSNAGPFISGASLNFYEFLMRLIRFFMIR